MQLPQKPQRTAALLFFLLPLVYMALYGLYGFADTDQGFVPALAWRITSGQVPYIDFCYVRPPLTPYLHALEMLALPRALEIMGSRLDCYLMLWASVYWGMQTLRRFFKTDEWGAAYWWMGTLAFIFSVHNFPPMPWHTVDGVFFGSLGIWLLTHPKARWQMALGLGALALAALAKQPFAILFPVGIVGLFCLQPPKIAMQVLLSTSIALAGLTAATLQWALPPGFLAAMTTQITGASSLTELLKTGLLAYLLPAAMLAAAAISGYFVLKAKPQAQAYLPLLGKLALVALALYPLGWLGLTLWKQSFQPPRLGFYHALLLIAGAYSAICWRRGQGKQAAALLLLSAIAWASSLSWGYAVPALFALPGLFALISIIREPIPHPLRDRVIETPPPAASENPTSHLPRALKRLSIATALTFFAIQQFPYRDGPRWQQVPGAGDTFSALGLIQTSPENRARLSEYKVLRETFPTAAVLPAMPAADYLMGMQPTLPIDWEHDAEVGPAQMAAVLALLNQPDRMVLVELSRIDEAHSADPRYRSTLLAEVVDHWVPNVKGTYFQLYTAPTKTPAN